MILARVTGRITSTIHHPDMEGRKLLVLDKLDADGEPNGGYVIAIGHIWSKESAIAIRDSYETLLNQGYTFHKLSELYE